MITDLSRISTDEFLSLPIWKKKPFYILKQVSLFKKQSIVKYYKTWHASPRYRAKHADAKHSSATHI